MELIDRNIILARAKRIEDVVESIEKGHNRWKKDGARKTAIASLIGIIQEAPIVAAVPVVRCGECKKKDRIECPASFTGDPDGMGEHFTLAGMEHCNCGEPRTPPAE